MERLKNDNASLRGTIATLSKVNASGDQRNRQRQLAEQQQAEAVRRDQALSELQNKLETEGTENFELEKQNHELRIDSFRTYQALDKANRQLNLASHEYRSALWFGRRQETATEALINSITTDSDPRVRLRAVKTIAKNDVPFAAIKASLLNLCKDQDQAVRQAAIEVLYLYSPQAAATAGITAPWPKRWPSTRQPNDSTAAGPGSELAPVTRVYDIAPLLGSDSTVEQLAAVLRRSLVHTQIDVKANSVSVTAHQNTHLWVAETLAAIDTALEGGAPYVVTDTRPVERQFSPNHPPKFKDFEQVPDPLGERRELLGPDGKWIKQSEVNNDPFASDPFGADPSNDPFAAPEAEEVKPPSDSATSGIRRALREAILGGGKNSPTVESSDPFAADPFAPDPFDGPFDEPSDPPANPADSDNPFGESF
jgi:hypothetical protein